MNILMSVHEKHDGVIEVAMRVVESPSGDTKLAQKVTTALIETVKREMRREVNEKLIDGALLRISTQTSDEEITIV